MTQLFRCKHSEVREKCLDLGGELTLEKAVKIGRSHETNLDSLKKLAKDEDPTVNVVEKRQTRSLRKRSNKGTTQQDRKAFFGRKRKSISHERQVREVWLR